MDPRPPKHSPAIGPGCVGPTVNLPYEDRRPPLPSQAQAHWPLSGAEPFAVAAKAGDPHKHTQYPYVTGSSVLAMTYKDGVMIACDTLGAYGTTKRYKSVKRLIKVNDRCVVGGSGEISDFQRIEELLQQLDLEDYLADDGISWTPGQVHAYLTRVMSNRRLKFDPLWNSLVVVGLEGSKPFCAMVSMIGVGFDDQYICTGFAAQLGLPLIRESHAPDMSEQDAMDLLTSSLQVCYYRDKTSINKFIVCKVTQEGIDFSEPFAVSTEWNFEVMKNPTKFCVGAW